MRRTIFAVTVSCLASTAVMASTSRELVGDSALGAMQQRQMASSGLAESDQGGSLGGKVILAKGDQSGAGPGHGGQKGQKKGGGKGKQKEAKDKG
jgi:hypothetical protein